jgi:hypothetical protein
MPCILVLKKSNLGQQGGRMSQAWLCVILPSSISVSPISQALLRSDVAVSKSIATIDMT